jgi:hypothetical protein
MTESGRLRTVEILPPGIDPTMVDATGNLVEEVNGDWCGADAPALIIDCGNVQYYASNIRCDQPCQTNT